VRIEVSGVSALAWGLLYGSGLRLLEALRLRVEDLGMDRGVPTIRELKGGRARDGA
jgi:integrase